MFSLNFEMMVSMINQKFIEIVRFFFFAWWLPQSIPELTWGFVARDVGVGISAVIMLWSNDWFSREKLQANPMIFMGKSTIFHGKIHFFTGKSVVSGESIFPFLSTHWEIEGSSAVSSQLSSRNAASRAGTELFAQTLHCSVVVVSPLTSCCASNASENL